MQQNGFIIFNERNNNKTVPPKMKSTTLTLKPEEPEEQEENEKLKHLTDTSNDFEFCIKAHWLFELMPNELIIDMYKLSFIDKTLMYKNVTSIPIKDVAKAEVTNDLFFATLEIINLTQTINLQIKHLRKGEARQALALIQGMMIAYKNNIDLAKLDPEQVVEELTKLGTPVT